MSTSMTAVKGTSGVTYTDSAGNPYRTDPGGIVHVPTAQVTYLTARFPVLATATAADFSTAAHSGHPLVVQAG